MYNSMYSQKADGKMVCVYCASTLHAPRWCVLPRIKVKKGACTLFQASPHHVLTSLSTLSPAQWRAPGKEDKDTLLAVYSSDHHVIKDSRRQTCGEHAPLRHFLTERYWNWISWNLHVSPSWCRHFQYFDFLLGAPVTIFALKRVKPDIWPSSAQRKTVW